MIIGRFLRIWMTSAVGGTSLGGYMAEKGDISLRLISHLFYMYDLELSEIISTFAVPKIGAKNIN